jgi:DNA repair protein RecO (recombination protein O)
MYTTEGIILKRTDFGEADSLFTVYTRDFGKIRARAQGIRKENAKLKGHLEPFSLSLIAFVNGKNGFRITGASLLQYFPNIHGDFERLRAASYIANLLDTHCLEGEKDEGLWELLHLGFKALEEKDFGTAGLKDFLGSFGGEFLSRLGYRGETDLRILGSHVFFPF